MHHIFYCEQGGSTPSPSSATHVRRDSPARWGFSLSCSVGDPWHFFIFFSHNLPTGTLSSVLEIEFFAKICIKILFCKHYFSPLNTFMRKGKDPDPEPDPYLWLMDPDPGGPKTCRIRNPNTAFLQAFAMIKVNSMPYQSFVVTYYSICIIRICSLHSGGCIWI